MAFAGWRPLALDVFDRPETLAALWDRLVQGYAMDALTDEPASVGEEFAYGFLKGIARDDAEATSHEGVGLGIDVILTSSNSVADALTWEGAVVHLAAFPRSSGGRGTSGPRPRLAGRPDRPAEPATPIPRRRVVPRRRRGAMNIGEPERELEIMPVTLPVPETVPMPAPEPSRDPAPSEEPVVVPSGAPLTGSFSTEPLIGWRVWNLVMHRSGRDPALRPAGAGQGEWLMRRPYRASCRRAGSAGSMPHGQHPSPVPGCTCGIYASSSLRNLVTSTPAMPAVSAVGTVALWGRVIEHERGWRAEFAYPDRLTLVCVVCLQQGSGAGQPAFVVAEPVRTGPYPAVAVCRDHAGIVTAAGHRVMAPAAVIRSALLDRYAVDLMPFDSVRSLFERDRSAGRVLGSPDPTGPSRDDRCSVGATRGPGPPGQPYAVDRRVFADAAVGATRARLRAGPRGQDARQRRVGRPQLGGVHRCVCSSFQSCIVTAQPSDAAESSAPSVVVPAPESTEPSTLAVDPASTRP